ncbi:hypothetical protein D3C85_980090 [compost metagenome]
MCELFIVILFFGFFKSTANNLGVFASQSIFVILKFFVEDYKFFYISGSRGVYEFLDTAVGAAIFNDYPGVDINRLFFYGVE